MSFQIFEQGRRIETPWQTSFPPRQVNRLEKSASPAPISVDDDTADPDTDVHLSSPASEYERQQSQQDGVESRKRIYRADQIMVSPVHSLLPTQTLDEAWSIFESKSIRHLPVVDPLGGVVGLVSQRHLLKMTSSLSGPAMARTLKLKGHNAALSGTSTVSIIMRSRILSATPDTNLRELTKVMLERHVGSILILSEPDHQLEGIITRSDVLKAVSHQVPLELWA